MIGVVTNGAERSAVIEFFELFKTPWEFWRPGTRYDVLLCSNSMVPENDARLLLLYGSEQQAFERSGGIRTHSVRGLDFVSFRGERIPIYGNCLLFDHQAKKFLLQNKKNAAAAISTTSGAQAVVRVGFDLFEEVHQLLT